MQIPWIDYNFGVCLECNCRPENLFDYLLAFHESLKNLKQKITRYRAERTEKVSILFVVLNHVQTHQNLQRIFLRRFRVNLHKALIFLNLIQWINDQTLMDFLM